MTHARRPGKRGVGRFQNTTGHVTRLKFDIPLPAKTMLGAWTP
jgi:hypothetical protein